MRLNQNQEDVEMACQDENDEINCKYANESRVIYSNKKEPRLALQELPIGRHSDEQNRMQNALNRHKRTGPTNMFADENGRRDSYSQKSSRKKI